MKSVKNQINQNKSNELKSKCAISGKSIPASKGVCSASIDNNSEYFTEEYMQHAVLEGILARPATKNILLTCTIKNCKLYNEINKTELVSYISTYNENKTRYIIECKDGLNILSSSNDASVKNVFTLLKKCKEYIVQNVYIIDEFTHERVPVPNPLNTYAPFYNKLYHYKKYHKGYNPLTKKSCVSVW